MQEPAHPITKDHQRTFERDETERQEKLQISHTLQAQRYHLSRVRDGTDRAVIL